MTARDVTARDATARPGPFVRRAAAILAICAAAVPTNALCAVAMPTIAPGVQPGPLPGHSEGASQAPSARDPLSVAQPAPGSGEAILLVEIPAGSATKFETAPGGLVFVDRFLAMPVVYPASYGALPSTFAGDGDPLDALVLARAPLPPGVLLRFRPVAVLRMVDGGAMDHKLVGVPADDVDPAYADIRDLADLPVTDRERIEAFFRVYKQLPAPEAGNPVSLEGWGDAAEARVILEDARRRYSGGRAPGE
ncbi:inorganic diphosphatase [Luteimonas sp. MJ204]|uniref:inorganic diphosphatase n=1 Tax=Luteimonas sp. MJ145 TaxID=3129234 RepID=UPI0031BB60DF